MPVVEPDAARDRIHDTISTAFRASFAWRIEHDYRELKDALGLDHFEGRTYRGWHHHVTLVSIAHASSPWSEPGALQPGRQPDPLRDRPGATSTPGLLARHLSHLPQRAAAQPPPTRTTNLTEHY